jgi:hypothetical protein
MKYRIKIYHYKTYSRYIPQWRFLWFWFRFKNVTLLGNYAEFFSKKDAQRFLDERNRKHEIEYIPYEN